MNPAGSTRFRVVGYHDNHENNGQLYRCPNGIFNGIFNDKEVLKSFSKETILYVVFKNTPILYAVYSFFYVAIF